MGRGCRSQVQPHGVRLARVEDSPGAWGLTRQLSMVTVGEQQSDTSWYGGTGEILTSRQCPGAVTRTQARESSRPPVFRSLPLYGITP
jgi:hypothetical protein